MNGFANIALRAITLWLLLWSGTLALAQTEPGPTPAGTILRNQAEVSYFDPALGETLRVLSNVSRVVVAAAAGVRITPPREVNAQAAEQATLPHTLTNIGNIADSYQLVLSNVGGDDGELINPRVYIDTNGNGEADAGEPQITQTPVLQAGESIELVIQAQVPSSANQSQRLLLDVLVVSDTDPAIDDGLQDVVNVILGGRLELVKTPYPGCDIPLSPGDEIRYGVLFKNDSDEVLPVRQVVIDGVSETGTLVEDVVPANVEFLQFESTLAPFQARRVLQLAGDGNNAWRSITAWGGVGVVQRVGLFLPEDTVPPGQTGEFDFSVQLSDSVNAGSVIFNTAEVDLDGNYAADVESNRVCNTVDDNAAQASLRFVRPSVDVVLDDREPVHGNDDDFIDAALYRLFPESGGNVLHDGVYLELSASQLNFDRIDADYLEETPSGERVLSVDLLSELTGDSLQVVVRETGPNTGVFRSVYPIVLSRDMSGAAGTCPAGSTGNEPNSYDANTSAADAIAEGCVLQSQRDDRLIASFDAPYYDADGEVTRVQALNDLAAVDPGGIVFDSAIGTPISGARVTLLQTRERLGASGYGSCEAVPRSEYIRALDPFTGEAIPDEITDTSNPDNTQVLGEFSFPFVTPGHCYFVDVVAPANYSFPSALSPLALTPHSMRIGDPSYGFDGEDRISGRGSFFLDGEDLFFDVPLDPDGNLTTALLALEKTVDRDIAEVGDLAVYTLRVTNNHDEPLFAGRVLDQLPHGFRYEANSAQIEVAGEWRDMTEPLGAPGPSLEFPLTEEGGVMPLVPGASVAFRYVLRLGPSAGDGDGVNTATAQARTFTGFTISSAPAQAEVQVLDNGVLSSRAILFGKVFVDSDCNNIQTDGEWPLGGVKLVMADGTWVITDENGQYSLQGLKPGDHLIKVDPLTLPAGLRLKPIDNRHAADPQSRFVDLRAGEFHRADFATMCPQRDVDAIFAEIKARNASISGTWMLDQAERFNPDERVHADRRSRAAADGDLAHGVLSRDNPRGSQPDQGLLRAMEMPEVKALPEAKMQDAKQAAREASRDRAVKGEWLWPQTGISHDGRFQALVRGGVKPELWLNGERVASDHLGEHISNAIERAQVLSWYGLKLQPGKNQLEISAKDSFGNRRSLLKGEFVKATEAVRLRLDVEQDTLSADGGRSMLPIRIRLLDRLGYPAAGVYFVSLKADEGIWLEEDIQDQRPGQQVRVRNGEALVHLRSSERSGQFFVSAATGNLADRIELQQLPPMRPLLAIGGIDINTGVTDLDGVAEALDIDEIENDELAYKAQVFMQGRIRGNAHLTLAYDSDKDLDDEEEFQRDLEVLDDYYPMTGDAAVRGYDADSRSKLYAKIEKGKASLMWGDFLTDPKGEHRDLGRVQRILTGVNARVEQGGTTVQAFIAEQEAEQVVEEIEANGTALLYRLQSDPRRESELVERIVRDRNNPGLLVSSEPLRRYQDYSINYLTGDVRFIEAQASRDENNNPVYLRFSYQTDDASAKRGVSGVRLHQQLLTGMEASASYTKDGSAIDGKELGSLSLSYENELGTSVFMSAAKYQDRLLDLVDDAALLELRQRWGDKANTEIAWAQAGENFDNPVAGVLAGREELRLSHEQKLWRSVSALIETSQTENTIQGDTLSALGAQLQFGLGSTTLGIGGRSIRQEQAGSTETFDTALVNVQQSLTIFGKPFSIGADYEQAVDDSGRSRAGIDMDWQLQDDSKLYLRYELIDSLGGLNQLSIDHQTETLSIGLESKLSEYANLYSEYRQRGVEDGRDSVAANGIRGKIRLADGLSISPTLEVVSTLDAEQSQDSIALSLGLKDTRFANLRQSLRMEARHDSNRDYFGLSAVRAARISEDWSILLREDLRWETPDVGDDEIRHTFTLGMARRPRTENRWHSLYMYQWKEERAYSSAGDRSMHLFSTHHNLAIGENQILSGRLGVKWQALELGHFSTETDALLLDGRYIWDITRRIDIDVSAGVLASNQLKERRHSFGLGVHHLLDKNLRIGLNYRFVGFKEEDLDAEAYNAQGLRFGLQYKFDEASLAWLSGDR